MIRLVPKVRELYLGYRNSLSEVDNEIRAKQDLKASLLAVRRVASIKAVLDRWVIRKGSQRILLLTANNGGNEWKAGGKLFVSNPTQSNGPGVPNTWAEWQNWKCDAWYISFLGKLLEVYESRRGILLIPDIDVEGELQEAYHNQGTCASVVLPFMWLSGSVLWYVSINFGRPWHPTKAKTDKEGNPILGEDGKPIMVEGNPITPEERLAYIANARSIYDDVGRCRGLIDLLRSTFNSVR